MSLSLYSYPDVFPITQDLSGYVVGSSGTTGVVVGWAYQGPVMQRTPITSSRQLVSLFGTPTSQIYPHYTAIAALEEMSLVYFTRVVGDFATMAATAVPGIGTPTNWVNPYIDGLAHPFDTSINNRFAFFGTDTSTAIVFYTKNPGFWGNSLSININNCFTSQDLGGGPDLFDMTVYQTVNNSTVVLEQWTGLSTFRFNPLTNLPNLDEYGRSRFVEDVLNARSDYLNAFINESATNHTPFPTINTIGIVTNADSPAGTTLLYFADTSSVKNGAHVVGSAVLPYTTATVLDGNTVYLSYPLAADVPSGSTISFQSDTTPTGVIEVVYLTGGDAGSFVSDSDVINGWQLYSDHNTISIDVLMNAGYVTANGFAVQAAMDAIASKRQDCIAILDVPQDVQSLAPSNSVVNWRKQAQNINSSFSALYTGWPLVYDPFNDLHGVAVPVSGFAGQVYARRDKNKNASWYAPAGLTDGLLKSSVIPIEGLSIYYDETTQGILYDAGINYVRMFIGGGYALWGQKTLQFSDSALNRVNVRRLLASMQRSIRKFLMTQVFELNNTFTRQTITNNINQFMSSVQGNNGVYKYLTVCDLSNNSNLDIDSNRVNVEVRIQPQKSAEFIIFTTTIEKTGTSLTASSQTTTALASSVSQ